MRDHWVENDHRNFHEIKDDKRVRVILLSNLVRFFKGEETVICVGDNLSVNKFTVALFCELNESVDLVYEDFVPDIVCCNVVVLKVEGLCAFGEHFSECIFNPAFENEELEDGSVGYLFIEVSVIKTITSVSKGDTHSVNTKFVHDLA